MIGLSYLSGRKQIVSINGHDSKPCFCFVWCTSRLSPFPYFICKVHHFADDTNQLHFSKSITKLDKYVNLDMKNLADWLNANKTPLNVQKTDLVIFKHQRKKISSKVKTKLSRKQLYPTDSVKYLGIRIDKNLNWKHRVNDFAIKLNRANA